MPDKNIIAQTERKFQLFQIRKTTARFFGNKDTRKQQAMVKVSQLHRKKVSCAICGRSHDDDEEVYRSMTIWGQMIFLCVGSPSWTEEDGESKNSRQYCIQQSAHRATSRGNHVLVVRQPAYMARVQLASSCTFDSC